MTNYAAPQENGHSVAFSGVAYEQNGHSMDTLIIKAGKEEGIYLAEFNLDRLRDYRRKETWGNSYRKPSRYSILSSPNVHEPFIRENARR